MFPHIRYCLTVWGNCSATLKVRVQKVINFGARIVSGLGRRDHVTPAHNELGWSTVDEMVREQDIAVMRRLLSPSCEAQALTEQLLHRSEVSVRQTRAVLELGPSLRGAVSCTVPYLPGTTCRGNTR